MDREGSLLKNGSLKIPNTLNGWIDALFACLITGIETVLPDPSWNVTVSLASIFLLVSPAVVANMHSSLSFTLVSYQFS